MDTCYIDDCHKKEWLRLRKLRLLQVREQSKGVAQEVRQRTKELQERQKAAVRSEREKTLEELKRLAIEELEKKYQEAMEKVGLAHKAALEEPVAEQILEERRVKNTEIALKRGKIAEKKQADNMREAMEKENAPIRRKEMTRDIEDIRSGLVVQSRDWAVINQRTRHVLLDIPVTNVDEFQPRQPIKPSVATTKAGATLSPKPKPAADTLKTPSPKRQGLKSPKSPRVRLALTSPYPSSRPSLRIPMPSTDLERLPSSVSSEQAPLQSQEPLVEFYDHRARYSRTYRLGSRLVQASPHPQGSEMEPPVLTKRPTGLVTSQLPPSDDEEMNLLLRRYASSPTSQEQEDASPDVSPLPVRDTPPTREHDFSTRRTTPRKPRKTTQRSRKNRSADLLKASDRAIKEGLQLWEKLSKDSSNTTQESDSESDGAAVVKLVVEVTCGQKDSPETEKPRKEKPVPSDDKGCQAEEVVPTRNAATEIGESLTEKNSESDGNKRRPKKRGTRKSDAIKQDGCRCNQYGRSLHYVCCPMQRTSTLEDLSERLPQVSMDVSSIHDETPYKSPSRKEGGSSIPDEPDKPPSRIDVRETSKRSERLPEVSKDVSSIPSVTPRKVRVRDDSDRSEWSTTAYLSPPTETKGLDTKEEEPLNVNPVLEYYIRTLLGMQPIPCESSLCTECECRSGHSAATQSSTSTNGYRPKSPITRREKPLEDEAKSAKSRPIAAIPLDQSKEGEVERVKSAPITAIPLPGLGQSDASTHQPVDYDAETERRLKRIAELKNVIEQIRKDQENIEFSSSTGDSSGSQGSSGNGSAEASTSDSRTSRDSGSRKDGGRSGSRRFQDGGKVEPSSSVSQSREGGSGTKPSPALEQQFKRLNIPDSEPAHRLSTIMEVDSKLQISLGGSMVSSSSSTSSVSSFDIMADLLRRELISRPFHWSEGGSLSSLDTLDVTLPDKDQDGKKENTGNLLDETMPDHNPIDELLGPDWPPTGPPPSFDQSGSSSLFFESYKTNMGISDSLS